MRPFSAHEPWPPSRRHRPPHAFDAGRALFVTAATHQRAPHLRSEIRKDAFVALLEAECEHFELALIAWVVLDEHYHLVVTPSNPGNVSSWLNELHKVSSRTWNREDGIPGRQCWYQFWDKTLWTEGDLWSRINYIHRNPVKHGYADDPGLWRWSSFRQFEAIWEAEDHRINCDRFPAPLKVPHDDF